MQVMMLLNGLFAVLLALVVGVAVVALGYRATMWLNPSIDEERELAEGNVSVAVVTGAFIFALGYLLKSAVIPIAQTVFGLAFSIRMTGAGALDFLRTFGAVVGQFLVALVVALAALWLGTRTFMWLNRAIDEPAEIGQNNLAVATLVAFITITLAIVLEPGVTRLLDVMIPSPQVQNDGLRPFG